MRTLPSSPNVDHLRRQAKDLLATWRQSDPSATLADAYAALATSYGYADWPQLKQAAEDQRTRPQQLAAPSVVAALLDQFALGSAAGPMVRVDSEWAGPVWEVEAAHGGVVFTELSEDVDPHVLDLQAGLIEQAVEVGVLAPQPIRAAGGSVLAIVGDTRWRAHRWLRLGPTPTRPVTVEQAAAAGRILAGLHALALPAPGPVGPWLTQRPSQEVWDHLASECQTKRPEWVATLRDATTSLRTLEAIVDDRDPDARSIFSHRWLTPEAVRTAGPHSLVVTGWDHAGAIPVDWELGTCVHAWAGRPDGTHSVDLARALLRAYSAATGTETTIELRMFLPAACAEANWTASRINLALSAGEGTAEAENRSALHTLTHPLSLARLEDLVVQLS